MPYTTEAPVTQKSAYQRPYKTRNQRRHEDRRKYDESKDQKFLWRVAGIVGILLIVALGFVIKGVAEHGDASAEATTQALH
jgi:hypothetical protein